MPEQRGTLEVRPPRHADEIAFANDLMAKAHRGNYYESLRKVQAHAAYPNARPEHTRLAYWEGELAGCLRIFADTIRLGEARLHMAGIGWVSTAEAHRHKGVARELLAHTLNYLRAQRYHVAMLFGIPNFYHRFGFATALSEHEARIDAIEAMHAAEGPQRVRGIKPGDVPAVQRLHNQCDTETACSLVRIAPHITLRWDRWKHARVLTDARGKVLAYFVPRRTHEALVIDETGVADPALCGAIIRACAALAQEEFAQELRFLGPPGHPMMQHLVRFRSSHETLAVRDEGGMMAYVDLNEALESMLPEWEARVQRSAVRSLRIELTLLVDRVPIRIRAVRGALDIAIAAGSNKCGLSRAELMQLMTGHRFLDEVLATRRRMLSPEARLLLDALFPKRTPYVWMLDRF